VQPAQALARRAELAPHRFRNLAWPHRLFAQQGEHALVGRFRLRQDRLAIQSFLCRPVEPAVVGFPSDPFISAMRMALRVSSSSAESETYLCASATKSIVYLPFVVLDRATVDCWSDLTLRRRRSLRQLSHRAQNAAALPNDRALAARSNFTHDR
jgi:hypothetical protein